MKKLFLIVPILLIAIQFIKIDKRDKRVDKNLEIKTTNDIKKLLVTSCYDCHSFDTVYPWYSNIAPFSWTILEHINSGRAALNFSIWKEYSKDKQKELLKKIYRTVYAAMPLQSYVWLHKDAKLSKKEIKQLRVWSKNYEKTIKE